MEQAVLFYIIEEFSINNKFIYIIEEFGENIKNDNNNKNNKTKNKKQKTKTKIKKVMPPHLYYKINVPGPKSGI